MPNAKHKLLEHFRSQLFGAVLLHRAPLWAAAWVPWLTLFSVRGEWRVVVLTCVLPLTLVVLETLYWRRSIAQKMWQWLNHASPSMEDSSQLLQEARSPIARLQQDRILQRLERESDAGLPQQIALRFATAGSLYWWSLFLNAVLVLILFFAWPWGAAENSTSVHPTKATAATTLNRIVVSRLQLHIQAPTYTGAATLDTEPKDLEVLEQSEVRWCVRLRGATQESVYEDFLKAHPLNLSNGDTLQWQLANSVSQAGLEQGSSMYCAKWTATESIFWSWQDGEADVKNGAGKVGESGNRWTIKIKFDSAPQILIEQPQEMLQVLSASAKEVTTLITVRDDYRVQNAQLHMTLARGSGENIRFSDREVPIPQGQDPKVRQWKRSWSLQELGMEVGDELYFFVRASDNAQPAPHQTTSPTYTLRMPSPEAKEEASSVLPILAKPESLRSQRQIIIDTETLLADLKANPRINPAVIRSRSETIANDQAALRRRYGKFLGEESSLFGDEEHHEDDGHAHGGEAQSAPGRAVDMAAMYGHAHDQAENATLFDEATKTILRQVLAAMWDAEKALRAITPASALVPENKALEGIKRLQQADRIYLHKAAFTPPAIKEEKRLSGDALEARNWKAQQDQNEKRIPVEISLLMERLANQHPLPVDWKTQARAWITQGIPQDDQRLAALAAVQDVSEGCQSCQQTLRAWLRQATPAASLYLQAPSSTDTSAWTASREHHQTDQRASANPRFQKAWRAAGMKEPRSEQSSKR
ncbi:hypothetical protein RF679_01830 [Undibacterium cyanobacteriorum]|uniref:DUF4175 domain-containing protein n=1 Tax=Undibacterium cyanobacteriorum TaxID=3073561 RepID=A0ABY9RIH8_9BURK|nr:hypothetical protein [Undibacterium sp. 20NA77.5]WMW81033.1 hypothetical protein RF679_01830 [Undibacterium sp. 20NA77.5]